MNIVLDTNCLIMSLSRRSPYYSTLGKLPEGVDLEKEIIWMKTQETATI